MTVPRTAPVVWLPAGPRPGDRRGAERTPGRKLGRPCDTSPPRISPVIFRPITPATHAPARLASDVFSLSIRNTAIWLGKFMCYMPCHSVFTLPSLIKLAHVYWCLNAFSNHCLPPVKLVKYNKCTLKDLRKEIILFQVLVHQRKRIEWNVILSIIRDFFS